MKTFTHRLIVGFALVLAVSPMVAFAHCDTLEGPVVAAARTALSSGDVTPVLRWVESGDEAEVRAAFDRTLRVRRQSKEGADLADTWLFETLVGIHRAGVSAPYTGLRSGVVEDAGIVAADHALDSGKVDVVLAQTAVPLQTALVAKFERVRVLRAHARSHGRSWPRPRRSLRRLHSLCRASYHARV